ncbi:MAG: nucleotidyltransferase family protein [Thalassobaculaceae bacterium]|nr:nucleotidyltransferase family protein [Thalassobaculaceae bacterium]
MISPDLFIADALANPVNGAILGRLPDLGIDQPWLVAGCLYQAVWNRLSERPPGESVKDYDVFYWDEDTSWEAEDAVIRRGAALLADLGVEVEFKNQKRVPIWYPKRFGADYPPVARASDGIDRFPALCTCVGLAPTRALYAPYGLDDLYAGRLIVNPTTPTPELARDKMESYRRRWPWLTIIQG